MRKLQGDKKILGTASTHDEYAHKNFEVSLRRQVERYSHLPQTKVCHLISISMYPRLVGLKGKFGD